MQYTERNAHLFFIFQNKKGLLDKRIKSSYFYFLFWNLICLKTFTTHLGIKSFHSAAIVYVLTFFHFIIPLETKHGFPDLLWGESSTFTFVSICIILYALCWKTNCRVTYLFYDRVLFRHVPMMLVVVEEKYVITCLFRYK